MREALHWRVVVAASACVLAVWIATSAEQAPEPPRLAPAVAATPYDSPYPAPRVDPSAPPQEPAPTF